MVPMDIYVYVTYFIGAHIHDVLYGGSGADRYDLRRDIRLLDGAGHGSVMLRRQPDLLSAVVDWLAWRLL